MKKTFAFLMLLWATAICCFAQDTISGVVSRVAAPYFEQNVCDSRFALVADGETYYVMVDNYWPNPYLEDLVVHYDTIAIGNEIEVVGNILEMEDGNGEVFQTIDVSKNLTSTRQQIPGFFYYNDVCYPGLEPVSAAGFVKYTAIERYYITVNGELQTDIPFSINDRTLVEDKRYLFIGHSDTLTDYYGNSFVVFELADALPYDEEEFSINGILTKENDLCLSSPCGETHFLSLFDGEEYRYLTNKRRPQNNYINDAVFSEGDSLMVGGFEFMCYDLFGAPFKALEIINMQASSEHMLVGVVGPAGIPYANIGPPIPGVCLALYCGGIDYYIRQPQYEEIVFYFDEYYVVGNDTIHVTAQQLTALCYPGFFINNYIEPVYTVRINQVEVDGLEESYSPEIQVFPNPSDDVICISSKEHSITQVEILDSKGCALLTKPVDEKEIQFNNLGIRGLLLLRIKLSNGNVVSKKIVVK